LHAFLTLIAIQRKAASGVNLATASTSAGRAVLYLEGHISP